MKRRNRMRNVSRMTAAQALIIALGLAGSARAGAGQDDTSGATSTNEAPGQTPPADNAAPVAPTDDVQIEMPPPPPGAESTAATAQPAPSPAPPPPPPPPMPAPAASSRVAVTAKYAAEIYGFVEFDSILDSTQALNETPGNTVLSKTGTFAANHSRLTFTGRNSRIGLKLKGPESELLRASAILEMDFLGNQPSPIAESALFTNPTFRFRHMALKMETPALDFLIGQSWQLFGWQSYFHPNTVEIQGIPARSTPARSSSACRTPSNRTP
jgi:hypothetical protein